MRIPQWREKLYTEEFALALYPLYKEDTKENIPRYAALLDRLEENFPQQCTNADTFLFSAPGRTEIGGNHTDHQHGRVLAASVNMDSIGAAVPTGNQTIEVLSEEIGRAHV